MAADWIKTDIGFLVYRLRYSLHETRPAFAKRFLVTELTVSNWERGRSKSIQPIHRKMLESLYNRLMMEGRLVPVEVIEARYRNADTHEAPVAG